MKYDLIAPMILLNPDIFFPLHRLNLFCLPISRSPLIPKKTSKSGKIRYKESLPEHYEKGKVSVLKSDRTFFYPNDGTSFLNSTIELNNPLPETISLLDNAMMRHPVIFPKGYNFFSILPKFAHSESVNYAETLEKTLFVHEIVQINANMVERVRDTNKLSDTLKSSLRSSILFNQSIPNLDIRRDYSSSFLLFGFHRGDHRSMAYEHRISTQRHIKGPFLIRDGRESQVKNDKLDVVSFIVGNKTLFNKGHTTVTSQIHNVLLFDSVIQSIVIPGTRQILEGIFASLKGLKPFFNYDDKSPFIHPTIMSYNLSNKRVYKFAASTGSSTSTRIKVDRFKDTKNNSKLNYFAQRGMSEALYDQRQNGDQLNYSSNRYDVVHKVNQPQNVYAEPDLIRLFPATLAETSETAIEIANSDDLLDSIQFDQLSYPQVPYAKLDETNFLDFLVKELKRYGY